MCQAMASGACWEPWFRGYDAENVRRRSPGIFVMATIINIGMLVKMLAIDLADSGHKGMGNQSVAASLSVPG